MEDTLHFRLLEVDKKGFLKPFPEWGLKMGDRIFLRGKKGVRLISVVPDL